MIIHVYRRLKDLLSQDFSLKTCVVAIKSPLFKHFNFTLSVLVTVHIHSVPDGL